MELKTFGINMLVRITTIYFALDKPAFSDYDKISEKGREKEEYIHNPHREEYSSAVRYSR